MASQPANSLITVQYSVRSYRDGLRHHAVLELNSGMMDLKMSVPGEEFMVDETRDATEDHLTTSLTEGRATGLPLVRHLVNPVTVAEAAADTGFKTGLAMPKRIGRDVFFHKTDGTVDLHALLRAV